MESPVTFSRSSTDKPVLIVLFVNRRGDDGKTRGRQQALSHKLGWLENEMDIKLARCASSPLSVTGFVT
jgi:hypothetical protein